MDLAMAGVLAALALIDSTSFGTLLIPIWLLLAPGGVRVSRMLAYLGTIAAFYFLVGVAIALGAGAFLTEIAGLLETTAVIWAQLVLGVGLFLLSFLLDKRQKRKQDSGRLARWRERAIGVEPVGGASGTVTTAPRTGTLASLMGLALAAAAIEVASMLPYLAAIGMITSAGFGVAQTGLTLAVYCAVMVLPALVLLAGRQVARRQVEPLLTRLNDWMTKHAAGAAAWVVGIAGFLLARDAAMRLGLIEQLFNR
ncbi:GAP family protein [Salininema proteolyticum]|uniref:GAP family protein n=1 Tax=Salininema proteolyticum TaxID=1607685 RepID=A0ABV8TWY4_9ACTN